MHLDDECEDCVSLLPPKPEPPKTKCVNGHDWNEENTEWRKDGNGISRRCVLCRQEASRKNWQKKKYSKPIRR